MPELTMEEITQIVRSRQAGNSRLLEHMIEVRRRYNAEWVMPFSTNEDMPEVDAGVPQLIAETIDSLGMRAASVFPDWRSLALDPMKDRGKDSVEYAQIRRKAIGYSYGKSRMNLGLRRCYRHLAGYATTSLVVVPDLHRGVPIVECRDPLSTYPEPKAAEDLSPIRNCAYVYLKSAEWIRDRYPRARQENGGVVPPITSTDEALSWELVEWVDEYCTVIGILGPSVWRDESGRDHGFGPNLATDGVRHNFELFRYENATGMCPAASPRRVTLDQIGSQVANMTGTVDLMARLQTLAIIAAEKSIFPDRYIIGDSQRSPKLVGGVWKDGRTGEVNLLQDAKAIANLPSTPDPSAQQLIDRLERNVRVSTGLVPAFGGETYGSLRTGRGLDSMMGAAVDPRIQEMQEVMVPEMEYINEVILATYKGYWPSRKYTVFSALTGDTDALEFNPSKHVETTDNAVIYPFPGMDVQGVTIQLGQLFGMKAISLDTVRRRHPNVSDAELEATRVETELLEQAAIEGLVNQSAQGAIPVTYLAAVAMARKNKNTGSIFEAIEAADRKLKEQQAADQAAVTEAEGDPMEMQEMQPGLAAPSQPMPGGMGPMPQGPPPDMQMPGEIGANPEQKGLRRLMEALSQNPPAQAV